MREDHPAVTATAAGGHRRRGATSAASSSSINPFLLVIIVAVVAALVVTAVITTGILLSTQLLRRQGGTDPGDHHHPPANAAGENLQPSPHTQKHTAHRQPRAGPCVGVRPGRLTAWQPVYSVVIDAGATATRAHVFYFLRCCLDNTFQLKKEKMFDVEGSIMFYTGDNNSKQIRRLLVPLLRRARGVVPTKYVRHTPLLFRATPSLSLLPSAQATKIIHRARGILSRSPFLVKRDHVTIMTGQDIAADLWLAANFLTG
ncbi:unnamed protein product, partial [Meganyctiphanes norvegica]